MAARYIAVDRHRRAQVARLAEHRGDEPTVDDYEDFARRVKGQNFTDAVLIGMGGSSLGPEVLANTFGGARAGPRLHVLDSTDPGADHVRSRPRSI